MLKTAQRAVQTSPKRQREHAAINLLPAAAWLTVAAAALGEGASLVILYQGSDDSTTRIVVLICTLIMLLAVIAIPVWKFLQTTVAIADKEAEERPAAR